MEDSAGEAWQLLREAQEKLGSLFARYDYAVLDTPLLEEAELFLRKVGGELAVRMYTFADPGGNRVVLRPEFTAPVVRRYLEIEESMSLPWRVQYAGPVFRYDPENGRRQFTQAGVEFIGPASPEADAEILDVAFAAPDALGIKGHSLTVGDAGVYHSLVDQLGLSERARRFLLSNLLVLKEGADGLERTEKEAQRLHFIQAGPSDGAPSAPSLSLDEETYRTVLRHFLLHTPSELLGQRTSEEIEVRLLNKLRGDRPEQVSKALEIAYRLTSVQGSPGEALGKARQIFAGHGLSSDALDRLAKVLELVSQKDIPTDSLTLDLGLARGLAYYTGFVFELRHPSVPFVLGGGGRYDSLVRELGHTSDVPALGFALTLENLTGLIGASSSTRTEEGET
jgi:histidyl-tRNA synthetase